MSLAATAAGLIILCDKDAVYRTVLCADDGGYASTHIYETESIFQSEA